MKAMNDLSSKKIIEDYLYEVDWRVHENSNNIKSIGALGKYAIGEVGKSYWLREVYNKENLAIADAHREGFMHMHDLSGVPTLYCCGYSLREILEEGVRGVSNIPTSSPAHHFMSALNQLVNLTSVFQNEIMGAVAFSNVDTLLAPYIKKDNLSYALIKQYIQNFIYSINSNSRAGAEPAFSNITLDLTPDRDMLHKKAIIAGEEQEFTYKDCQPEIDKFNKAFCEIMIAGDFAGKGFPYPIPTYNIHERFDWENPNNDLLWEMTGKYGIPYFANFINSDMSPEDARSMCPLPGDTLLDIKETPESEIQVVQLSTIEGREVYIKYGTLWKRAKGVKNSPQSLVKIVDSSGKSHILGEYHQQIIIRDDTILTVPAGSIKRNDYLIYMKEDMKLFYPVVDIQYQNISDDLYCVEVIL